MSDQRESTPVRVFLDANVLYAAALGGGCEKLWRIPNVQLVTSEYAANEAWVNLRHQADRDEYRARMAEFLRPPLELISSMGMQRLVFNRWNLPDPTDVPILAGAIEARCDYLLTGDGKCFGDYFGRAIDGVLILRPGRFLASRGE